MNVKLWNCKFAHSRFFLCVVDFVTNSLCACLLRAFGAHFNRPYTQSTRIHSIQFNSFYQPFHVRACAQCFFVMILFVCLFCENQKHTETHTGNSMHSRQI